MLKYSVKFSIKNSGDDSLQQIRIRVSFNSLRPELYSGISVTPSQWDKENERITEKKDKRNTELHFIEKSIEEIFQEFEYLEKRFPTAEELKLKFAEKRGKKIKNNFDDLLFFEMIQLYMNEKSVSKQWTEGTYNKYVKLRNHAQYFSPKLKLSQIKKQTFGDFVKYFENGPKDKNGKIKPPHRNTTIRRNIEDYQRILHWAKDKGYYSGTAHEDFEQTYKGTTENLSELVYLEWDELLKLYNHDFKTKNYLARVRDVFCFCCFSSLRFSDVEELKKSDIRNHTIMVTTQKTTDTLVIELNDFSKEILSKYKDQAFEDNLALPVISMTKTNEYLKEIGSILELNSPIKEIFFVGNKRNEITHLKKDVLSTHAARRTFVVNALRLGIPSEVIIKWTGHKDFKNLKPYVKIVDELKRNEMDKFNITPENIPDNL